MKLTTQLHLVPLTLPIGFYVKILLGRCKKLHLLSATIGTSSFLYSVLPTPLLLVLFFLRYPVCCYFLRNFVHSILHAKDCVMGRGKATVVSIVP
jgi:ABC-type arginine/histidine transport system permease subunit